MKRVFLLTTLLVGSHDLYADPAPVEPAAASDQATGTAPAGAANARPEDKTNVDFEAQDVTGTRRNPMDTLVDDNTYNTDVDFVKIRKDWLPEMTNSTATLDYQVKRPD